jgi:hypothetical protein
MKKAAFKRDPRVASVASGTINTDRAVVTERIHDSLVGDQSERLCEQSKGGVRRELPDHRAIPFK